jgi:O-antigen ligase
LQREGRTLTSSAALDLAFGVIAMLVIFVLATTAKRTVAIGALLAMIPFQVVETRYGSSSVMMAYALAVVLVLTGPLKLRMLPALGLIVLGYLMSFVMAEPENLLLHVLAMVQFFSALVVFILAYNFARSVETGRSVLVLLLVINALVIVYCVLQLTAGPGERFTPFGIESLAFNVNRTPDDPRLVGAFGNPGSTAGYFTLMTLVCAVAYMFVQGGRKFLVQLLIGLNLLGIVVTGNRTGFLTLLMMFPIFLFVFRSELGAKRVAMYLVTGTATLAVASAIAIYFTDFDRMFGRLERVTETESGVPSTRSETWPIAIEKIRRDPWFGEGPYYPKADALMESGEMRIEFEDLGDVTTAFDPYPHSLYLFLLRTVGVVGLIPVVGFFIGTWVLLYRASRGDSSDRQGSAIVRLGLLLIPAFLVAQVTLEFNRPETLDYAHFIFALMGLLVGTADRGPRTISAPHESPAESRRAGRELVGTEPVMR